VPPPAARYGERASRLAELARHPDLAAALEHTPPRWRPLLPTLVLVACALVATGGVLVALHAIGRGGGADRVLLLVGGVAAALGLLRLLDDLRHPVERHVVLVAAVEPSVRRANRPPRVHLAFDGGDECAYDLPPWVADTPVEGAGGVAFVRARRLLDLVVLVPGAPVPDGRPQ